MPLEWVYDEDGFCVQMLRTKNNRLAPYCFKEDTLDNMHTLPLRDDDVILCSYSKTGCHWVWENLRYLLERKIFNDEVEKIAGFIDNNHLDKINSLPSPRLLNTHVFFDAMPTDILKGRTKLILLYRNPKDVAVSFFHMDTRIDDNGLYTGQFRHYIKRFVKGDISNNSYFEYLKQWEEGLTQNPQIPYLIMSYEDFYKNPISERRRLASFVGRTYDDEFLQAVMEATSIDNMRETKGAKSVKDFEGLPVMYRKGAVGDWKNNFTVSQNEWFDEVIKSHMSDSKMFKFVYS